MPSFQLAQLTSNSVPENRLGFYIISDSLGGNIHTNAQISLNIQMLPSIGIHILFQFFRRCCCCCWYMNAWLSKMQKSGVLLGITVCVCVCATDKCSRISLSTLLWVCEVKVILLGENKFVFSISWVSNTVHTYINSTPFDHFSCLMFSGRRRRRVFFSALHSQRNKPI